MGGMALMPSKINGYLFIRCGAKRTRSIRTGAFEFVK